MPNATDTRVYGINDAGTMVGWYIDQTGGIPTDSQDAAGKFTKIDPPGATMTNAWSINTAGVIVGTYTDSAGVFHGFVDAAGTFTPPLTRRTDQS